MGYSFPEAARVLLHAPSLIQDSAAFVTPVVEHWLEREIAEWVHHEESLQRYMVKDHVDTERVNPLPPRQGSN